MRDAAQAIVDRYRSENNRPRAAKVYDPLVEELIDALAEPEPTQEQTPMSDDQIMATASHFFDSPRWPSTAIDLARAVERHHGIGGKE